jgi:hypothetical protein
MNTLKAMSPQELIETKRRLAQHNILIHIEDNYINLLFHDVQTLYGREYKSWEIVKNGFTNEEVVYLTEVGFRRPDPNAFQAWGDLNA